MSFMFKSLLEAIPKNRSEIVNELEIPNIVLTPASWKEPEEPEEDISVKSDGSVAGTVVEERGTLSTDSSLALSRAMTDSEIDYEWFKTLKKSRFQDNWAELEATMATFPSDYLTSLYSYRDLYSSDESLSSYARERQRRYNDELKHRLDKLYDEVRVFDPDDPSLQALEDAVKDLKIKAEDWEYKSP